MVVVCVTLFEMTDKTQIDQNEDGRNKPEIGLYFSVAADTNYDDDVIF